MAATGTSAMSAQVKPPRSKPVKRRKKNQTSRRK